MDAKGLGFTILIIITFLLYLFLYLFLYLLLYYLLYFLLYFLLLLINKKKYLKLYNSLLKRCNSNSNI
jgi:hypothetical protein